MSEPKQVVTQPFQIGQQVWLDDYSYVFEINGVHCDTFGKWNVCLKYAHHPDKIDWWVDADRIKPLASYCQRRRGLRVVGGRG